MATAARQAGNELVEHLFLPAFRNPELENLGDARCSIWAEAAWHEYDSFVVQPLFFPADPSANWL